jgi:hypothetical protein
MAPIRKTDKTVLEAIPTLPSFFDKARLDSPEFDKYIYEIKFKKTGKTARGLTAGGHIHALHPYIREIRSELVDFGFAGEGKRNVLSCIVKVIVTLAYRTDEVGGSLESVVAEAFGESDVTEAPPGALVRTAETRALNRALERLDDVSKADLNNAFVGEDEWGSPAQTEVDDERGNNRDGRVSPQSLSAKKRAEMEAELDVDNSIDDPVVEHDPGTEKKKPKDDW